MQLKFAPLFIKLQMKFIYEDCQEGNLLLTCKVLQYC